jgi:hypothetical protein
MPVYVFAVFIPSAGRLPPQTLGTPAGYAGALARAPPKLQNPLVRSWADVLG